MSDTKSNNSSESAALAQYSAEFNPENALPQQLMLDQLASAQQQLDLLKEAVMQSQRLATIGTISAVIAHEFNNILTPVISYAQYALQSAESDKPDMDLIRKALSKSFTGATKAGRICTSMLGLARGRIRTWAC